MQHTSAKETNQKSCDESSKCENGLQKYIETTVPVEKQAMAGFGNQGAVPTCRETK